MRLARAYRRLALDGATAAGPGSRLAELAAGLRLRRLLLAILPALPGTVAGPASAQPQALEDTRWRLLSIQSMDDSTYTPATDASYTLALDGDGTAVIDSDCNRLRASWQSDDHGRLTFSNLAGDVATCSQDSLDQRYRAQFEWVRSFILRDGHLFLATMADGSIMEFRALQAPPVVATLLGDDVRSTDPEAVQAQILGRLFDAYRARRGLEVRPAEVDGYLEDMERTLRERLGDEAETGDDLSPEEQAELRSMREQMARAIIGRWKLNKALFEEYGGRVIFQQFGPEPLDAYRLYLEERRDAGDFTFSDEEVEAAFWRYFVDESMHTFYPPEDAGTVFATAPWED